MFVPVRVSECSRVVCGGQQSPSCTDAGSSVTTQLQPRVWSWCWCCLHCLDPPASQPLSAQHVIPWYTMSCQTPNHPTNTNCHPQDHSGWLQSITWSHLASSIYYIVIPFGTFLSDGTICIRQASQNWFLDRSVRNIFTKHSTVIM